MRKVRDLAYRSKYVVSVGSLEEKELANNMVSWLWKNGYEFRIPEPDETIDDYVDYLFALMEQITPAGRYFGTPDDSHTNLFGFFHLPDKRKR